MEQANESSLIAFCGLNCGACKSFKSGHCLGCHASAKNGWCGVRACCIEHEYASCADCRDYADPMQCEHFNNFFSRVMGLLFNSDRAACIAEIRSRGIDNYAHAMSQKGLRTMPRRGPRPDLG